MSKKVHPDKMIRNLGQEHEGMANNAQQVRHVPRCTACRHAAKCDLNYVYDGGGRLSMRLSKYYVYHATGKRTMSNSPMGTDEGPCFKVYPAPLPLSPLLLLLLLNNHHLL
jgi:hypothetical protein